jgi:hypothetical protein
MGLANERQVWTTIMSGTVTAVRARQYYKETRQRHTRLCDTDAMARLKSRARNEDAREGAARGKGQPFTTTKVVVGGGLNAWRRGLGPTESLMSIMRENSHPQSVRRPPRLPNQTQVRNGPDRMQFSACGTPV